ncbi:putative proline-rich basic protein 1, partial [Triplophysa rosa]
TKSYPSINEKVSQNIRQIDEGESDPEQADDIMDDSASSYYTALCSLSEYGEDINDRTHTQSTECLVEGELLDCTISVEGITSRSTKTPMVQCIKDTLLKRFVRKPKGLFQRQWDFFHTNIRTAEQHSYSQHRFTSNTILISPDRDQYSKGRKQEHSGTQPKEDHATQQQRPREGLSACLAESRFDRGGYIRGHMVKEGEGEGSCKKKQAELSLRFRNRKQESRIPPHCYSESIPATRHQPQLQTLADTQSLEKQSRNGVWLSSSLSYKQFSSSWQPCHSTDNTRGTSSMGTKLAEASSKVGALVNLAQVRSSCSEAEYLHVFSSTCRPSHQPSANASHNNWTDDVLSFKMQMYSKAQNTSACSESSSFECIDVAVETTEEINRGLKTVPKRQIQLKRRDTAESHARENDNETRQVPQTPMRTRDIFQRQHSMPVAFHQESHMADQMSVQAERKQRLQKSFSLDETSSKTKMASCILISVLSKKMQHEQNLHSMDSTDASINVNRKTTDDCLHLSGKDAHAEMTKPKQSAFFQNATLNTECSSFQQYNIVNSKIQPKPLSKHSFNPLLTGIERSEIQGSGTEITVTSENEKAEKVIPREEATQLPNLNPGAMLSCDSAKGRTWNSSAATSAAISPLPPVKTTPEECHMGQRIHKQPNVTQNLTNLLDKQEKHGGSKESTLRPTNIACLISDLEANMVDAVPQDDEGGIKEQESNRKQVKLTSLCVQSQGKLKAMAPVHVVRDMRSLVKNTYNLPFKGPAESTHGASRSAPLFQQTTPNQNNDRDEEKGKVYRQDEKHVVRKVTPPLSLDRIRDLASHHSIPRGCSTKAKPPVESNDKSHTVGFTKVSPTKPNSCAMSKPPETQSSQVGFCKGDVTGNDTNLKPTNRKDQPQQTKEEKSTEVPTKRELNKAGQETGSDNDQPSAFHSVPVALPYYSPTVSVEQQDHGKMISDDHQTPCLPPRSQSSVGPLSGCVLTVASTPMVPSCYYKANPLGYQTISPQIGAVHGYVQGPLLFQTPLFNQLPASSSHTPLLGSLSEDGKMLVQQSPTYGSTNHAENEESMPSPESIQNTIFVAPLSAEARLRGAGVLGPEAGRSIAAGQHPCQLLLDPETGCCFYVDMTQLPQRKMLFDPQTCQFVEVILPQQTLTNAILSPPCGIPFASLHIPPMYTPHYLPYVQTHPQVFQPPTP